MDPSIVINERVEVAAVFRRTTQVNELCFPVKMKFRGETIIFSELALRHPTTLGKRMVHVFDMSDGTNDYRLEFDAEGLSWKLIAMVEGHDVRH